MKKSLWLVLVLGLAFAAQGCGFDPTIDSSVMIVKSNTNTGSHTYS